MSARFPSRWLLAAVLLLATGFTARAQSLPSPGVPQTAPAPAVGPLTRLLFEPLLLEQEQVSEHSDRRSAMPPPRPAPARAQTDCVPPTDEVLLRCLLFAIHPLFAFLPIQTGTTELPSAQYLDHVPLYLPPSPEFPCAVERLTAMPTEVERLGVMPAAEESELKFEFLRPWTDDARLKTWRGAGTECATVACGTAPEPVPAPLPHVPARKASDACPADGPQVQINVVIAEVTTAGARKLSLDHVTPAGAPRWVIEVAAEGRCKALCDGLDAQRQKGRAKLLATPTLITLSGQRACLLIGGEQAITLHNATGQAEVQYVPFGTQLTCCPTVFPDGKVRLQVEPEISEVCEAAGAMVEGTAVPGRSTQRVETMADLAPGQALVISGPKAGGNTRLLVLVTPTVIKPAAETGAIDDSQRRMMVLKNQAENLRQIDEEMKHWMPGQPPSRSSPERVNSAVSQPEDSVHDLLVKCQRELSCNHFAAAEDLAQEALTRDREAVLADPLVCQSNLLRRVKAFAVLPLGTVSPCESKPEGRSNVAFGEGKAIGSDERMTEALMQEYNTAFREGRYGEAAALAERALQIDPDNAVAAGALSVAWNQLAVRSRPQWMAAQAMARFRDYFQQGRYEEAQREALAACCTMPDDRNAQAALKMACMALAQEPHPSNPPQCTYPGSYPRPADPAVVSALQKLLLDNDKPGPAGGSEEAEPKVQGEKPLRR
jgi:tetratricopeptide (TPR) repeat protein